MAATQARIKCSTCPSERDIKSESRLPPRWKRIPESNDPCCPLCWDARYFMRAVTVPIQGPDINGNPTEMGEAWKDLRTRLYAAWDASTRLANWSVQQLQRLDVVRTAEMKKIQPMPKDIYLYGLFGAHPDREAWAGAAASAQSVMRTVEANWRSSRFDVLWMYNASARTYRWPTPFPVHNRDWELSRTDQGIWSVSLTLPGGRLNLRIRNDATLRYQRKRMEQLLAGRCGGLGEAALYARVVQGNDRNNGLMITGPGGKQKYRVMLKLVAWFPRPDPVELGGRQDEMRVSTGNASLLTVEQNDCEPWLYHGDDLRRKIIGYLASLQRHRDDTKAERRFPAHVRRRHLEDQQKAATKHNNRVTTEIQSIAAMVAALAARRKVASILYDDSDRGFIPQMPYFQLKGRIEQKANELGIQFRVASGATVDNEQPEEIDATPVTA